mgnify:CR=1 FL=1
MNLKNRILQFIEYKGITVQEFEKRAGLSNASVSKMGDNTRTSTLDKISNSYPELNVSWLRTGEGEMLTSSQASMEQDTDARKGMIPFYDAETTGGHNGRVSSSNSTSEMIGYIHAGGWFAGRETAAIRHVGESMTEYPNGCILAVREVLDRNLLVPGKNYVIETSEYRVTKRMQHGSSKDTISLYSTNQEKYEDGRLVYEPFEVRLVDVRRIFSVLGYIVNQSGEFKLIKI